MSERLTGGCLCEAVRYVCEAPPKITVHCYCTDCRKIGGTGHATHSVFDEDVFLLTGRVSEFEKTADSGRKNQPAVLPGLRQCAVSHAHRHGGAGRGPDLLAR
ncbi:GFA family protein [Roseibium salinum]|nr:GFA family protein [Roseibium salinum]